MTFDELDRGRSDQAAMRAHYAARHGHQPSRISVHPSRLAVMRALGCTDPERFGDVISLRLPDPTHLADPTDPT